MVFPTQEAHLVGLTKAAFSVGSSVTSCSNFSLSWRFSGQSLIGQVEMFFPFLLRKLTVFVLSKFRGSIAPGKF
jgi:hypothetical protein